MAASASAFALAVAIYAAVCTAALLFFDLWRRAPWTQRFYAPRRYIRGGPGTRPRRLPNRYGRWAAVVLRQSEREVIATAGVDAAMYLKVLRCGLELFAALTLITCAVVLPVNITGAEVESLLARQAAGQPLSNFTYWAQPRGAAAAAGKERGHGVQALSQEQPKVVKPPDFYVHGLPSAPAGLEWWEYRPDVPLLPRPAEVLGPNYSRFGWRYDARYQEVQYSFSNLDKATMANVAAGSRRLYVHTLAAWAVTGYTLRVLWRYNKEAVRLRIHFLLHSAPGAESYTVLVTDIPGILYGTVLHRADKTLLRFLPQRLKDRLSTLAVDSLSSAVKGFHAALSSVKQPKDAVASGKLPPPEESQYYFDAISTQPSARSACSLPPLSPLGSHELPASIVACATPSMAQQGSRELPDGGSSEAGKLPWPQPAACASPSSTPSLLARRSPSKLVATDPWAAFIQRLQSGLSVEGAVEEEFRGVYGDQLDHVYLARDTSRLDPLVQEYEVALRALTDLLDHYAALRRRSKTVKPRTVVVLGARYGRWGLETYGPAPVKVDKLEFLRDRLVELRRQVAEEQARAMDVPVPAAFVTFKTRQAQVVAADALMCRSTNYWRCRAAPGPGEVVWANLGLRLWERGLRQCAGWAAFCWLALFFMVPVTAVQSLLTLNSVTTWLAGVPLLNALLTAILPGLALKIFLCLLPWIISRINLYSGMTSQSEIALGVTSKYFSFLVITVVLASFVAGSFANQLRQFVDEPSSVLTVLGTAAPQTAIFFMTYLLLQALLSKPLSLLRLGDLVKWWLRSGLAPTARARARLWQEQTLQYGTLVPDDTIAMLLGLVFCLVCPLIAPVALAYFAVALCVQKYHLLYVWSAQYQSGGKVWTRVFSQVCFGLFLSQLVLMGLLGVKRTVAPVFIVLPLPILTAGYWWACREMFRRPQEALALAAAAALDAAAGQQGSAVAADQATAARHLYLSPSFRLDDGALAEALTEAAAMLAWLEGGAKGPQDVELGETSSSEFLSAEEEAAGEPPEASPPPTCFANGLFRAEREGSMRRRHSSADEGGAAGAEAVDVVARALPAAGGEGGASGPALGEALTVPSLSSSILASRSRSASTSAEQGGASGPSGGASVRSSASREQLLLHLKQR